MATATKRKGKNSNPPAPAVPLDVDATSEAIAGAVFGGLSRPADGHQVVDHDAANADFDRKWEEAKPTSRKKTRALPPAGTTSTTTPGGIARHDPAAAREETPRAIDSPVSIEIPLELIDPNPYQPRQEFDLTELAGLAASIRSEGLLQAIAVRRDPATADRYQLIDGERRLRASKLAGLKTIRAEVRLASDEQMAAWAIEANEERQDLNAIEKAAAWKRMIEEFGWTQQRIADKAGMTQGAVSNVLRLLDLPQAWQQRVISQEMPATHARYLLPYKDVPEVLGRLENVMKAYQGEFPAVREWEEAITDAVWHVTEDLDRHVSVWQPKYRSGTAKVELTDELRQQLRVIECRDYNGNTDFRALNAKLAKKLLDQAEAELKAQWAKDPTGKQKGAKAAKDSTKPTEAQLKAKAKERAAILEKRIGIWKIDWLQYLAAQQIKTGHWTTIKLLCFMSSQQITGTFSQLQSHVNGRGEALARAIASDGSELPRKKKSVGYSSAHVVDLWAALTSADQGAFPPLAAEFVRGCLWDAEHDDPAGLLPDDVIEGLAVDLGLDLEAAWRKEMAGPLTEEFLEIHTKDELLKLGDELGVYLGDAGSKTIMVKRILGCARSTPLPACLTGTKQLRKAKPR